MQMQYLRTYHSFEKRDGRGGGGVQPDTPPPHSPTVGKSLIFLVIKLCNVFNSPGMCKYEQNGLFKRIEVILTLKYTRA